MTLPAPTRANDEALDADSTLPRLPAVMMLVLLGAVLGAFVTLVGAKGNPSSKAFVETPQFGVWLVLIAAQTALWAVGAAVFLSSTKRLRRYYQLRGIGVWLATGAFATAVLVVAAAPLVAPFTDSPLLHQRYRSGFLGILGAAVGAVGAQVIARIAAAAEASTGLPSKARLERFVFLRDELQLVLFFLGAMVGAATLASGAIRHALLERGGVQPEDFPPEIVLAYGAYFSLLLAAAYVPAYRVVLQLGRRIRDDICGPLPTEPEDPGAWSEWRAQREPLEEFLQLKVTAAQRLQTGLAILAPLAGGAVSLLIGVGK